MLRPFLLAIVAFGFALEACSPGIVGLNQRPMKYYEHVVAFKGRISRLQELPGEVLLEVADVREHRIIVRAPAPIDAGIGDWVKVEGILVPEARVGDRVVYDVVLAESVSHARAPMFDWLF